MNQRGSIPINGHSPEETHSSQTDPPPAAEEPKTSPRQNSSPRRPRSERPNAFDFSSWLLEGLVGLTEELQHNDLGLPEEFWTHAYAARREALLAARALIDTALAHCDKQTAPSQEKPRTQRGQVDIDFG